MLSTTQWSTHSSERQAECPACGSVNARHLLDLMVNDASFTFVRCASCGSLLPAEQGRHMALGGYQTGKLEKDLGLKHYLEIGAGIASLYEPIHAVAARPSGALLDVGCGFGFLVDLWGTQAGCSAQGIELASYGHWGRELLGIDISHELLPARKHFSKSTFNIVFAGEVLEHVSKPAEFLRELGSKLAPNGVICITTPDADAVSPAMPLSQLLASLSPGAHQFLLTKAALRHLMVEAGLEHVKIDTQGDRLIAWGSQVPLQIGRPGNVSNLPIITAYLERLSTHPHDWVRGGALYRLFREAVNQGDYSAAWRYCASLDHHLQANSVDVTGAFDRAVQASLDASTQDELIEVAPCYVGPYLFYRGMLELNSAGSYARAAHCFITAARVISHWMRVAPAISPEHASLLETALYHARLSLKFCGEEVDRLVKSDAIFENGRGRLSTRLRDFGRRIALASAGFRRNAQS